MQLYCPIGFTCKSFSLRRANGIPAGISVDLSGVVVRLAEGAFESWQGVDHGELFTDAPGLYPYCDAHGCSAAEHLDERKGFVVFRHLSRTRSGIYEARRTPRMGRSLRASTLDELFALVDGTTTQSQSDRPFPTRRSAENAVAIALRRLAPFGTADVTDSADGSVCVTITSHRGGFTTVAGSFSEVMRAARDAMRVSADAAKNASSLMHVR